jgi:ABC-type dipeptide/oligopeptide/nickel transport system ATPase subunit
MPIVQDFIRELNARSNPRFGSWHRIDLHNHTPLSHDYRYHRPDVVDVLANRIKDSKLSVVMFTDHEVLPDPWLVEDLGQRTGKLILPGVELNVLVEAFSKPDNKIDKDVFFHLLVGFDPEGSQNPAYWLNDIYRRCSKETRSMAGREAVGISASMEQLVEVLKDANAIVIPAHLHTDHNAMNSRSVDDIYADPVFLKFCSKKAFTALEVRELETADYFDGKHVETGNLHLGCIRSSDSHDPADLGLRFSYAQMERPTYNELKAALELASRTSVREPVVPSSYIVGVHIRGQFFPDLWLSFSPHCNMLIAVKGSGKTSVLECLRFALGADVPTSRADDVRGHLQAILGPGGTVTVLVKRADGERVIVERSMSDPSYRITLEDDRVVVLGDPNPILFPTQILGWHEIEQAATDARVRRVYMDAIAGRSNVGQLEDNMRALGSQISYKHTLAAQRYRAWRDLQKEAKRLKDQRDSLKMLTDNKMIELRDQYDAATQQREALDQAIGCVEKALPTALGYIQQIAPVDAMAQLAMDSPLAESVQMVTTVLADLKNKVCRSAETVRQDLALALDALRTQRRAIQTAYSAFVHSYQDQVATLSGEEQRLLETHRDVLERTKQLPALQSQRDTARAQVLETLHELVGLCEQMAVCLEKRTALRRNAVQRLNERLMGHGVRLSVHEQERPIEYQDLSSRYALGAQALEQLWGKVPVESHLLHKRLGHAYTGLINSLDQDYGSLMFDSASDLYRFVSLCENDDLVIEFQPHEGKGFKRIDQLSAGQRCTAVFPILLQLNDGPLIVDQPEDNLDNRHIASVIAPALQHDKQRRQMMFTSHNANLVVLSDAEAITMFESDGVVGRVEAQGFLATRQSTITRHVIDILDGGDKALEQRSRKYGPR